MGHEPNKFEIPVSATLGLIATKLREGPVTAFETVTVRAVFSR